MAPVQRAKVFGSGRVEIVFNMQETKLEAPSYVDGVKRHWLPCSGDCNTLQSVAWEVVAITCDACAEESR